MIDTEKKVDNKMMENKTNMLRFAKEWNKVNENKQEVLERLLKNSRVNKNKDADLPGRNNMDIFLSNEPIDYKSP
jgi:hypothetical protein